MFSGVRISLCEASRWKVCSGDERNPALARGSPGAASVITPLHGSSLLLWEGAAQPPAGSGPLSCSPSRGSSHVAPLDVSLGSSAPLRLVLGLWLSSGLLTTPTPGSPAFSGLLTAPLLLLPLFLLPPPSSLLRLPASWPAARPATAAAAAYSCCCSCCCCCCCSLNAAF